MSIIQQLKSPEELLEYMNKNITYGFVGRNGKKYSDMFSEEWNDWNEQCLVQSGEDVLKSKIGTCWDQVELERLWFEINGYYIHTFFIQYEVNRKNDYPTHTFLIYEKDNKFYWFENAFESERGIHEFDSLDEAIENVNSRQIKYTKMNHPDASDDMNTLAVYEYSKPVSNLDVDDYLNYVTTKQYISSKTHHAI